MKEKLQEFLAKYIGPGKEKKDRVLQEDVDMLVQTAVEFRFEQEIIDYGTAHPDASFWDFLDVVLDVTGHGLHGITQEELDADE